VEAGQAGSVEELEAAGDGEDEYREFLKANGIEFDERYLL
jgi:hypothetical protein